MVSPLGGPLLSFRQAGQQLQSEQLVRKQATKNPWEPVVVLDAAITPA